MQKRPLIESLEDRKLLSTFTVENLADNGLGSLRQAILDANGNPGADVIRFARSARDGTVTLTSGELVITDELRIDGPGAGRLSVSGNDASRVFRIAGGVSASIDGLTVTHGRAFGQGGGILNAGSLTLSDAVVSDNRVTGIAGASLGAVVDAFGGGICNTGALDVRHTRFIHNHSIGADGSASTIGSSALGGAIMSVGTPSAPPSATITQCSFEENEAIGGAAGTGASRAGIGGAVMNGLGTMEISQCLFDRNLAVGGLVGNAPGGFGAGSGGAIGNVARAGDAILSVSHSILTANRAVGGDSSSSLAAQDGRGGAIASFIFGGLTPPVTVVASASVDHCLILGNEAIGGDGATGGAGQGGGLANLNGGRLDVSDSRVVQNRAIGGAGDAGNGGNGQGGGIFNGGPSAVGTPILTLRLSLVACNRADGGASGGGSAGLGQGGGLYLTPGGAASADQVTEVLGNDASTSDDDVFGTLSRTARRRR
ncbi:MAG: hypothetical protein U0790_03170 [Isosphaeraceae bacterium]